MPSTLGPCRSRTTGSTTRSGTSRVGPSGSSIRRSRPGSPRSSATTRLAETCSSSGSATSSTSIGSMAGSSMTAGRPRRPGVRPPRARIGRPSSADPRRTARLGRRHGGSVTRFRQLAAATVVATFLLVTIGVIVRATDSGVACPTWPGCFEGQFLPRPEQGSQVWIEWTHRTVAAVIGVLILGLAIVAIRDHRDCLSLLWSSLGALGLVGFQAWLGRETVRLGNTGESVTAHLVAAMALEGLLIYLLVRSFYPARIGGRGASQRFTLLAAFGAAVTFALLLFGSHVTAASAWNVFPDWPLMGGSAFPALSGDRVSAHVLHRWIAVLVGLIVVGIAFVAWRTQRRHPPLVALAVAAGV